MKDEEMPKGWHDLKAQIDFSREDVVPGELPACSGCIDHALELIKKLAGALKESHGVLNQYKDVAEQNPETIVNNYVVLTEFEEWK